MVVTETEWKAKSKIPILWPLAEKSADSWFRRPFKPSVSPEFTTAVLGLTLRIFGFEQGFFSPYQGDGGRRSRDRKQEPRIIPDWGLFEMRTWVLGQGGWGGGGGLWAEDERPCTLGDVKHSP